MRLYHIRRGSCIYLHIDQAAGPTRTIALQCMGSPSQPHLIDVFRSCNTRPYFAPCGYGVTSCLIPTNKEIATDKKHMGSHGADGFWDLGGDARDLPRVCVGFRDLGREAFLWDQTLLVTAEEVEGVTGATVVRMMIRRWCGIRMLGRSIPNYTLHPFLVSANEKTETSQLSTSGIRGGCVPERLTCQCVCMCALPYVCGGDRSESILLVGAGLAVQNGTALRPAEPRRRVLRSKSFFRSQHIFRSYPSEISQSLSSRSPSRYGRCRPFSGVKTHDNVAKCICVSGERPCFIWQFWRKDQCRQRETAGPASPSKKTSCEILRM